VAHRERVDPGPLALAVFETGDPLAALAGGRPELVEVVVEP